MLILLSRPQRLMAAAIFFLLTSVNNISAQNLTLNPGLEDFITCPGFGQFDSVYVSHWTKPTWGSTDYYNDSCTGIQPVNQAPHGGNGYFGIIAYNYGTEYREYATGKLSSPLAAGTVYGVEFYVSLHDGYIQAIDEMGAYLSAAPPGPYANSLHIPVTPHVQNVSGTLSSTVSWMHVSGIFTAAGGEQYITIGNFNDDSSTTISQVGSTGSYGAYYFVDDVTVNKGKATAISSNVSRQFSVIPNPSHGIFQLHLKDQSQKEWESWEVFDCSGRKIISGMLEEFNGSIPVRLDFHHLVTEYIFCTLYQNAM
jgi:hypothetical protein